MNILSSNLVFSFPTCSDKMIEFLDHMLINIRSFLVVRFLLLERLNLGLPKLI